jgi:tRNA A58 N-methylase Trm61
MFIKIKTWEQMEKEYGLNDRENINLPDDSSFSITTENLLPKNRIIEVGVTSGGYTWLTSYGLWGISEKAVEEILTPSKHPQYFI